MDPSQLPSYTAAAHTSRVHLNVSHALIERKDTVLLSLKPPAAQRPPVRVVCVVDLSGSMDDTVSVGTSTGTRESDGLTILDIVKHAVKTIISSLADGDQLAIVSFSDQALLEFPMSVITLSEKENVMRKVDSLVTTGSTNIWGGLDLALDTMKECVQDCGGDEGVSAILLFTDGQPNIRPPAGELAMLQSRKMKKFSGQLPCIINTFGFGYNLDSELLNSLAVCGNGSFAFIPDAGFVGTVFVDAACNLLSSALGSVTVTIEPENNAQVQLFKDNTLSFGNHPCTLINPGAPELGFQLHFGSVQAGQPKDVVIHVSRLPADTKTPYLKVTVSQVVLGHGLGGRGGGDVTEVLVNARGGGDETVDRVVGQWARLLAVQTVMDAFELAKKGDWSSSATCVKQLIGELKKVFEKLPVGSEDKKRVKELLVDLEGQVVEALSQEYFNKWGKHYLLSLLNAHRLQQCNNFKDPGVQVYQTPLFEELRDEINEIFLKLPPPKPSRRYPPHQMSASNRSLPGSMAAPAPVNMSRYMNAQGVCFSGDCLITLADSTTIPVKSIQKGTRVLTTDSRHTAPIHCMVVTHLANKPSTRLIRLSNSGLVITPYHPVKLGDAWVFPCSLPDAVEYDHHREGAVDAVYSAILGPLECVEGSACGCDKELEYGPSVHVNGVQCAALGHEMVNELVREGVIGHAYFGCREKVLEDVKRGSGYAEGIVECEGVWRKRVQNGVDEIDGMVIV
ncbi:hypothetical protein HDU98_002948 [Podochytrium sp. JEL0797]|nr:hypothetical protein HDU98_002948 [Podochytrium sp. JEL0797]